MRAAASLAETVPAKHWAWHARRSIATRSSLPDTSSPANVLPGLTMHPKLNPCAIPSPPSASWTARQLRSSRPPSSTRERVPLPRAYDVPDSDQGPPGSGASACCSATGTRRCTISSAICLGSSTTRPYRSWGPLRIWMPRRARHCLGTTKVIDDGHSGTHCLTGRLAWWKDGPITVRQAPAAFPEVENGYRPK